MKIPEEHKNERNGKRINNYREVESYGFGLEEYDE